MPNEPTSTSVLIDEVEITTGSGNSLQKFSGSFSSIFSHIFYNDNNTILNYSLKDFFDTVKNFFSAPMHMIYQKNEPKDFNIKEWYKLTLENNN